MSLRPCFHSSQANDQYAGTHGESIHLSTHYCASLSTTRHSGILLRQMMSGVNRNIEFNFLDSLRIPHLTSELDTEYFITRGGLIINNKELIMAAGSLELISTLM